MITPLDLNRLATVQLVPLTPFSRDGQAVLPDVLGSYARSLYEAGIRVLLPGAGTGEFHSLAAECGDRLGLYCGTAERFAPFFHLAGARGYTSGAGNLCPRLTLALHAALRAGRFDEAFRLLALIRPIEDYRARDGESYSISML